MQPDRIAALKAAVAARDWDRAEALHAALAANLPDLPAEDRARLMQTLRLALSLSREDMQALAARLDALESQREAQLAYSESSTWGN